MFSYGTHRASQEREARGYSWLWSGVPLASSTVTFSDFSFHAPYSILGLRLRGANDAAILPGAKGFWPVPFDCTLNYWTLIADKAGSIEFDILKTTAADFPPDPDDTIITLSAERPSLVNSQVNWDRRLAGWNVALLKDEIIAFNVLSAEQISSITLSMFVTRYNQP